jgi:hypothetical protein
MSRSLEEIRNSNKREDSLINTKVGNREIDEELIEQGKEEFERFMKPIRDRVYDRYLEQIRKLDKCAIDGLYTDPKANAELNNLRIRDLINWCKSNNKDISKLSIEEIMKFVR